MFEVDRIGLTYACENRGVAPLPMSPRALHNDLQQRKKEIPLTNAHRQ